MTATSNQSAPSVPQAQERPASISAVVTLLYVVLALGVIRSAIVFGRLSAQAGAEFGRLSPVAGASFVLFVQGTSFAFVWFLIFMIGRRRNWARVVFLVMFVVGIPFTVKPLIDSFSASPISGVLGVAQLALQITALYLLFRPAGRAWFRRPVPSGEMVAQASGNPPDAAALTSAQPVVHGGRSTGSRRGRRVLAVGGVAGAVVVLAVVAAVMLISRKKSGGPDIDFVPDPQGAVVEDAPVAQDPRKSDVPLAWEWQGIQLLIPERQAFAALRRVCRPGALRGPRKTNKARETSLVCASVDAPFVGRRGCLVTLFAFDATLVSVKFSRHDDEEWQADVRRTLMEKYGETPGKHRTSTLPGPPGPDEDVSVSKYRWELRDAHIQFTEVQSLKPDEATNTGFLEMTTKALDAERRAAQEQADVAAAAAERVRRQRLGHDL